MQEYLISLESDNCSHCILQLKYSTTNDLSEHEVMQSGWKRVFFAIVLQSFPEKLFFGQSIMVKTVENMVLLNSSPTLFCHRPCFSKDWIIQMLNILSVATSQFNWSMPTWEGKEWLCLTFQRTCWAWSIRHSEGGFSEQYVHVTPNLDVLKKIHDRRPKAFQVMVELATDGESFLAAVHQKRKQPPAI